MSEQILHLDFLKLTRETDMEQRSHLSEAAALLDDIDGVEGVGVIQAGAESDFDLAFWFVLRDFAALEPFGTHPRYTQFLQGAVAPLITGFAGADVKLEAEFEGEEGAAACLALIGPDEAYDFEVREALDAWAGESRATHAAIGLAIGEKQVYRGAAIAFGTGAAGRPEAGPFRATLIAGMARLLV